MKEICQYTPPKELAYGSPIETTNCVEMVLLNLAEVSRNMYFEAGPHKENQISEKMFYSQYKSLPFS